MKYQSSTNGLVYDLDFPKPGRYVCPICSVNSKRKNPKDVQFYNNSQNAYCHKCETTYFPYNPHEKKEYKVPERINNTKLSDEHLKYWNGRMISQETLIKLGVFSYGSWMCFPFLREGEWVNVKSRTIDKRFKLVSGAELIWYNYEALLQHNEIIICEGEGEVLTYVENGFNNVVSVPNGANIKAMEYLDNTIKLFDNIKTIYIANDNDVKGVELRDELARRLGPEKCLTINYKECKDGNEYFVKYGGLEFKDLIKNAKPIPMQGVVNVNDLKADIVDLYENGIQPGSAIEIEEIDKYCTWELGRLATVTGLPGSGKSEFVDYLITRLNLLYGWKAAYFTPENYPLKYHYAKLHEKYSGLKFKKKYEDDTFWGVYEHIQQNFYYIMNEEDMSVKTVIDNAKLLVRRYGVKMVVIDPYNKLDHQFSSKTTETQYISKFLDEITSFAKFYNVLVFLVAHPRKMQSGETPTLYDIAGSANFYNKTDYGFTVERIKGEDYLMTNAVKVHWQKIKFKHLGEQGTSELKYNYNNGRFETGTVDQWDNSNWLYSPQNNRVDFTEPTNNNDDLTITTDEIPF